jgi:hypothetical protein
MSLFPCSRISILEPSVRPLFQLPLSPYVRFLTYLDVPAYVRGDAADGGVRPPVSCYDVAVQLLLLYGHPVDIPAYSAITVQCHILNLDGNEKRGGSGRRQKFSFCLALWRSRVICNLNVSFLVKTHFSVSGCYSFINRHCLDQRKFID